MYPSNPQCKCAIPPLVNLIVRAVLVQSSYRCPRMCSLLSNAGPPKFLFEFSTFPSGHPAISSIHPPVFHFLPSSLLYTGLVLPRFALLFSLSNFTVIAICTSPVVVLFPRPHTPSRVDSVPVLLSTVVFLIRCKSCKFQISVNLSSDCFFLD